MPTETTEPAVRHLAWLSSLHADDLPRTVTGARYLLLTQMVASLFTLVPLFAAPFVLSYPALRLTLRFAPTTGELPAVIGIFLGCAFLACCTSFLGSLEEWARNCAITLEGIIMIGSLILITGGEKIGTISLVLAIATLPFLVAKTTKDACFFRHATSEEISLYDYRTYAGYAPRPIASLSEPAPLMHVVGYKSEKDEEHPITKHDPGEVVTRTIS